MQNLITSFYSKALGDSDNSCGAFVLLLNSILDIARERSSINSVVCTLVGPNPETGSYAYPFAKCAYIAYAATLNASMTPKVLNANDITLVSQNPMTYRYHN